MDFMLPKQCRTMNACSLLEQNDYLRTQRFGVTVVFLYDPGNSQVVHVSALLHSTHPLRHAK